MHDTHKIKCMKYHEHIKQYNTNIHFAIYFYNKYQKRMLIQHPEVTDLFSFG